MSLNHGSRIVTDGLLLQLDPSNLIKHGSSPYKNLSGGSGTITNNNFTTVDGIFRSDCVSSATGTSYLPITGLSSTTGSVTVQFFINITTNPNVDSNNNWRRLIAKNDGNRDPFGFVLEQSTAINFTLQTSTGNKRYLDSVFTPISSSQIGVGNWNMVTYTYNATTGDAACYLNKDLIRSGPMTSDGSGSNATVSGEKMADITSSLVMEISHNNTSSGGDACLPADLGPWMIYNTALTHDQVKQNFNALRGRFGL